MIKTITMFAWLRDLAIVLLFIAGLDLRSSLPKVSFLLIVSAAIIFVERALWSWYLCDLKDQQHTPQAS